MIRVILGEVHHNSKIYKIGETVTGLSEKEESRLLILGVCELVEETKTEAKTIDNTSVIINVKPKKGRSK